jgi:hypothetical protein
MDIEQVAWMLSLQRGAEFYGEQFGVSNAGHLWGSVESVRQLRTESASLRRQQSAPDNAVRFNLDRRTLRDPASILCLGMQ